MTQHVHCYAHGFGVSGGCKMRLSFFHSQSIKTTVCKHSWSANNARFTRKGTFCAYVRM